MTTPELIAIGANLAALTFNLVMVRTRHRSYLRQRDYWETQFVRALPFVLLVTHGPFKSHVAPEVRQKGEALIPESMRADLVRFATMQPGDDDTIN